MELKGVEGLRLHPWVCLQVGVAYAPTSRVWLQVGRGQMKLHPREWLLGVACQAPPLHGWGLGMGHVLVGLHPQAMVGGGTWP